MRASVWSTSTGTQVWLDGKVDAEDSVDDAINRLRGVTELASWVAPTLLVGQHLANRDPSFGAWEFITCGKCMKLVFDNSRENRQLVLSVDLKVNELRRARLVSARKNRTGDTVLSSDYLITYAPEFDLPEKDALVEQLKTSPW